MGYWPISSNSKRSLKYYQTYIENTLDMIPGEQLVFLTNNLFCVDNIFKQCEKKGIALKINIIDIEDMDKFDSTKQLLQLTKKYGKKFKSKPESAKREKGIVHYWRDLKESDDETFRKVFCVWHSKIDFISSVANINPFNSSEFAWIDASISRFSNKRVGWQFNHIEYRNGGTLVHYPSKMKKYGKKLALNASFLLCDLEAINKLNTLFDKEFQISLSEVYPNDEETLLDTITKNSPELFRSITDESLIPKEHHERQVTKWLLSCLNKLFRRSK